MRRSNHTASLPEDAALPWELALDQPDTANANHISWSIVAAVLIVAVACLIMVFGAIQLQPLPQFTTFHASFVFIADAATGLLLLGQFRYRRLPSYLFLACAYLFSSLVTLPFLLTFPGALLASGSLFGGRQSSIWVWHFWHILFPAIVVLALLVHARPGGYKVAPDRVVPAIAGALALIVLLVAAVTLAVTVFHDALPVLIDAGRNPLTQEFYIAGGTAALLNLFALLLVLRQARQRSILHIWLAVSVVAFMADIMASLGAHARYTLGWYGGRIEAMIAASILLPVFLGEINLLYRQVAKTMAELAAANRQLRALLEEKDRLVVKLQESEKQVRHLAYHDVLSGLPNRRLLMDRLQQALVRAKRHHLTLAVMYLDLDRFKEINDRLGHDIGDELIRQVAKRLVSCVRSGDTVSRTGGDEFVILLSEIERHGDAALVAEKIIDMMGEPFICRGHELKISISIGIALHPAEGLQEAQELIQQADSAMYQAKQRGRNQYCFNAD